MLFIIIHQVYELWFRQQLHEGDRLVDCLVRNQVPEAGATLKRMLTILKTMVQQIDVLETMTPVSFLSFRSFLANSSGFQSAQFREFEFLLGNKNPRMMGNYPEGSPERAAIEQRFGAPTVYDAFAAWVAQRGGRCCRDRAGVVRAEFVLAQRQRGQRVAACERRRRLGRLRQRRRCVRRVCRQSASRRRRHRRCRAADDRPLARARRRAGLRGDRGPSGLRAPRRAAGHPLCAVRRNGSHAASCDPSSDGSRALMHPLSPHDNPRRMPRR